VGDSESDSAEVNLYEKKGKKGSKGREKRSWLRDRLLHLRALFGTRVGPRGDRKGGDTENTLSCPQKMLVRTAVVVLLFASGWSAVATCAANPPPDCGFTRGAVDPSNFKYKVELGDSATLHWKVLQNAAGTKWTHVCFGLVGSGDVSGWTGFGVTGNPPGGMVPSGVVVVGTSSSGTTVASRRLTKGMAPNLVVQTTVFSVAEMQAARVGGKFNLQFARRVDGDEQFPIKSDKETNVVWAAHAGKDGISPNNELVQHTERGAVTVNFFTGATFVPPPSPLHDVVIAHAAVMFFAWAVVVPFMSILARFKWRDWWFPLHKYGQTGAVGLALAAFGGIVYVVQAEKNQHFSSVHEIMGLVVICLAVLQPVLGVWADKVYDPNRHAAPLFPDGFHALFGWLLYVGSQVTIVLGLILFLGSKYMQSPWFIAAAVWIGLVFVVLLVVTGKNEVERARKKKFLLLSGEDEFGVDEDGQEQRSGWGIGRGQFSSQESEKLLDSNVSDVAYQALGN
jgi:Eukaryotic cytochrome b561